MAKKGAEWGEPVTQYKKPNVGKTYPICTPVESDEFDGMVLGPQWQWQANYNEKWAYFAGDKGFTHPELNAYALRHLRQAIEEAGVKRGFSNSRTCEIGLTTHSGIPYQSLIYLIDEVTR